MSKLEKLIEKILQGRDVSYEDAEVILVKFGFSVDVRGSHMYLEKKDI